MTLDLTQLLQLAWISVRTPRDGARAVTAVELDRLQRWQALLLIVLISVILGHLSLMVTPGDVSVVMAPFLMNPLMASVVQMSMLVLMVFAIYWIGHAMGGAGRFEDAILLVAWMQFILVCLQVIQTAAMLVMPPLAGLIGVGGFILFFWLLTNFVAELHGFKSLAQVFLMVLVSLVGIAFGLSLILSLIGVTVPGV